MRDVLPDSSKGLVSEHAWTWRIVFWIMPPLVRLGLIDGIGSMVLGGLIGIVVVFFRSNRSPRRQDPPVGQDLGPTFGSRGVFPT